MPDSSSAWQLWHRDLFDADAERSLQASGVSIESGLFELWRCTLQEAILENGVASFSRFHLTWGSTPVTRVDIAVDPFKNPELLKLRRWVKSMAENSRSGLLAHPAGEKEEALLMKLAILHRESLLNSARWTAAAIDWSAESKEVLSRVAGSSNPDAL